MTPFSFSQRTASGLFALAFTFGIAAYSGSTLAAPGGLADGARADTGLLVLAKNDGKGRGNQHRNGNGDRGNNWSKNDRNWNGNNKGNKNWSKNNDWVGGKNWNKHGKNYGKGWGGHDRGWNGNWNRGYVREWNRKPYYGEFFGGIILGSLLAATAYDMPPYPPAPGLCWYWADPYMYRGYWDYCD
jgi:hypothetical protein